MNGFTDHGLDESAFGEKKGFSEGIRSFDAFRKTRPATLLFRRDAPFDYHPPLHTVDAHFHFHLRRSS